MTEHSNREHKELDNDAIRGGNRIGDFFRAIGGAIEHAVEWVGRASSAPCRGLAICAARSGRRSRPSDLVPSDLLTK
ncbi:hypothetical protein ACRQ5Q_26575 [Bradyrhizobium sp. PMVTL-01]|uniref:hypothetical protein n=1 Tax=unclassified Bradyrhizobium TaxID=2631580 RepID=UPI003F72F6B1